MSAITICNGVLLHTPHFLLLKCFVRQVQVFTSFTAGLKRAIQLELLVASGAFRAQGLEAEQSCWCAAVAPPFGSRLRVSPSPATVQLPVHRCVPSFGSRAGIPACPATPELPGTPCVKPACPWHGTEGKMPWPRHARCGADVPRFLLRVESTKQRGMRCRSTSCHLFFWELRVSAVPPPTHHQLTAAPRGPGAAQAHPAQIT